MRCKFRSGVAADLALGEFGEQVAQWRVQVDGRGNGASAVPVKIACRKDRKGLDAEFLKFTLACARSDVLEQKGRLTAAASAGDDAEFLHREFCRDRLHVEQGEVLDGDSCFFRRLRVTWIVLSLVSRPSSLVSPLSSLV